jgi:excisionase family DNA binding protein
MGRSDVRDYPQAPPPHLPSTQRVDNEDMPEPSPSAVRMVTPAQVGEALQISVDEVVALVLEGRLRGARVGSPPQWRIEEASVTAYLDDQSEEARRIALWRESNAASFPELWGTGTVRHPD